MSGRPHAPGPSVTRGLTRALTTYVVLLLLVGAAGVLGLAVTGRVHDEAERYGELREANTQLLLAMTNAETGVRGYRLSQDRAFLAPYEAGRREFDAQLLTASERAGDHAERRLLRRQAGIARQWFVGYAEPVATTAPGQVVVDAASTQAHKRTFDRFRAANAALDDLTGDAVTSAEDLETTTRVGAAVATALALAASLVLALVTHRRSLRSLEAPLRAVVGVLGDLAAGERAARAETGTGPEEVRVLARSVNDLADEGDRLREERRSAARSRRLAVQIGRAVRDTLVDGDPVAEVVSRLGEGTGVDRVYVRTLEEEDLGDVQAEWQRDGLAPLGRALDGDDSLETARRVRALHSSAEPFVADDFAATSGQDAVTDAFVARTGATAALIVPVGAGGRALGVLCLLEQAGPRAWQPHEVELASSVAADLGRALVLARLLRQQEQLVAQLRDLDAVKTQFLSTVSHELRTPLTSISGYVEMVRDGDGGDVPPEAGAMLEVVERNTARLASLIEDLLTLSRIESGTFRVSHADVLLGDVVAAADRCLRPAAQGAGLALEVVPDAEGLVVHADAVQLERALVNLVSNAVKFTPPGGRVAVRVRAAAGWAEVEVADTGIGIPAAEQGSLFSRFFRASNATELAIPGTGLGLMIVRTVVEHHGGELEVVSAQDEGTTVTVRLPLGARRAAAALGADEVQR